MTQEIISSLIFSIKKLVDLNIFYFTEFDFVYKEYVVISDTSFPLESKKNIIKSICREPELSIS